MSKTMGDEDLGVAPQSENQPTNDSTEAIRTNDNDTNDSAAAPTKTSLLSGIKRFFQSSGLRRPSKIPRLQHKQQHHHSSTLSVSSTVDVPSESTASKLSVANSSSAVSIASSSRETTPLNSPIKRLREPTKLLSRKRPRDEILSQTMAAVADKLQLQQQHQQLHSQELSSSSQTTHDDAVSLVSSSSLSRLEDDSESHGDCPFVAAAAEDEEEEEEEDREQELRIAKCLQTDLLRDRARLRLQISSLRDDVEVYYELLARMEQVAVAFKSSQPVSEDGDVAKHEAILSVADRIQAIISAKADPETGATADSVVNAKDDEGETATATKRKDPYPPTVEQSDLEDDQAEETKR